MYASLKSIGSFTPEFTLTNAELEKMVDTTDEWISKRTGIKERKIAKNMSNSDMGVEAAKIAIKRAKISKDEIDMVITATISPDFFCMPSTACVIADKLEIYNRPAFDISAACSGFIYLLSIAKAYIESSPNIKNILIIGTEKLSAITDFEDRGTCVLFGDGAGAAIIGRSKDKKHSIVDVNISSDGRYQDFLQTPGGGSLNPASQETLDNRLHFMKMKGNETFKLAVKTLANDVKDILAKNSLTPEDIDFLIPHQANYRIIKAVGNQLSFKEEQIVVTVQKYGNTSAASIPMAIDEIYKEGRLKNGDMMLLDAFGGGLTWGSALVAYNGD